MRQLTSIVALNEQGAIGAGNALPWRIRTDLRFFRQTTLGHIVIMGRRTFDSLGKGLPGRTNIVVTHNFGLFPETDDCKCSGGIVEALALADRLSSRPRREVFIVGGASMYEQFAPYVDRYLITEVSKDVPNADTFFGPEIVGDHRLWHWNTLQAGEANPAEGDEADFRIFEALAKDPMAFDAARNQALQQFGSAGGLLARGRGHRSPQYAVSA